MSNKFIKNIVILFIVIVLLTICLVFINILPKDVNVKEKVNCNFTRTYTIYNVLDSNDYKYQYITIREFNGRRSIYY